MGRFLVIYLIVTGLLGAIAIAAPGLVVVGFFLLVLPGVILMLMPSAFVYGALFSLIWWPLRPMVGVWVASAVALAGTAAVVVAIPAVVNRHIQAEIDTLRASDVDAAGRIPLSGVIRYERTNWSQASMDDPEWKAKLAAFTAARKRIDWSQRPVACDALCAATLFTPGIDAVSIDPMRQPGVTTTQLGEAGEFSLEREIGCTDSLEPGDQVHGNDGFKDVSPLKDAWRVKISQGECIRRSSQLAKPDYTISLIQWSLHNEPRASRWRLKNHPVHVLRMDMRDKDDTILSRRTRVKSSKLTTPLFIEGSGDLTSFSFSWSRTRQRDGQESGAFTPVALLAATTPLQLDIDLAATVDAARAQLDAVLADPTRPASDPAFALPERIFRDIGANGLRPGDGPRIEAIVGDSRTRNFTWIWDVVRKMGPDAVRLRDPIVRRIMATPYPSDSSQHVAQLGSLLRSLPPGTFATLTEAEARLLDDPGRRNWAAGLVHRQSDRGAAASSLLTRILVDGWTLPLPPKRNTSREMSAANAARSGLCVLGPQAPLALSTIEDLLDTGAIQPRVLDSREWQITLIRLGKPIDSFVSPPNNSWSDEQLRQSLRARMARFNPARDCA